ncbi:MAG: SpoIIE family protein phosphatase [Oscillospiraceae bacterium]|nr:SpoIIE family protein phosphatase [Oscillospiraceae bacterium]
MSETQAIVRTRKRSVDRWMPGERMRKAQETALRVVSIAGQVLPGFLLSFADVMGIPSGLQAAWMAALAVMGESLLWPAGGCVLALVMRLVWGLPLRLELLLTLGVMLLAPVVIFRRGAWAMMGWTALSLLPTAAMGIFAGTAADGLRGIACVAVSALSAPVMLRGLRALQSGKPMDGMEARVALGYTVGMLLCGGGRMLLFGLNLGVLGAAWVTLCMGLYLGVAAGAVTGMASGLVLALQGLPVNLSVALSVGGFLGGMVQGLGRRWLTCVCFALGSALTMLLSGAAAQGSLWAVLAASAVMVLLGRTPSETVQALFRRFVAERPSAGDAYAASALASWEKVVEAMARAVPSPVEGEEKRDGAWWKEHLCAGCQEEEECPCMLTEKAVHQAEAVWADRMLDEEAWSQALDKLRGLGCGRLYHLWQGMEEMRNGDAMKARMIQKACYQRDMLVTHMEAMAGAARRFAQLSSGESWWDEVSAKQLRKRLSELAFPATLIYARRVQGHAQAAFELHRSLQAEEQAQELREIAAQVLDIPMDVAKVEEARVLLAETPLWAVESGMAACGVDGSRENGDTYWLGHLSDGRYLAALSDGMGHGALARQESGQTVTLLRLCLEAGYTRAQTLTAVNGMMLLASRGERFSTVDLVTIDLWTGQATLDKLGAAASRLLRGRSMTELTGDALPLGILETVDSRTCMLRLHTGDELVLMTDGVEDAFASKSELDEAIREAMSEPSAQTAADRLLRTAREAQGGRKDDMSVIVLRISKTA